MSVTNVGSKWSGGSLIFFDRATGNAVLTIASTGITSALLSALTGTVTLAGDLEIAAQHVKGSRFTVSYPNIAAADVAKAFFIAPAACKLISAYEVHGTVCDAADTLTIEKCTAGEDAGAGDVVLAAAWAMNSTANTPVSKAAVTTAAGTLAAGDSLLLKYASGDGTDYAEGCVTCTLEWL